jgi:diaminopimelate epimerase
LGEYHFFTVNTGVPHAVTLDPVADFPSFAAPLRENPAFGPEGTNISALERTEEGLQLRTFERGVETETLACGTAACAASVIASHLGYGTHHKILVASGEELEVTVEPTCILQKGTAHHLFDGVLYPHTGMAPA